MVKYVWISLYNSKVIFCDSNSMPIESTWFEVLWKKNYMLFGDVRGIEVARI